MSASLLAASVPFACRACTFLNPSGASRCEVCGEYRDADAVAEAAAASLARSFSQLSPSIAAMSWLCTACTYMNRKTRIDCKMCGNTRAKSDAAMAAASASSVPAASSSSSASTSTAAAALTSASASGRSPKRRRGSVAVDSEDEAVDDDGDDEGSSLPAAAAAVATPKPRSRSRVEATHAAHADNSSSASAASKPMRGSLNCYLWIDCLSAKSHVPFVSCCQCMLLLQVACRSAAFPLPPPLPLRPFLHSELL